ncbi:MAG: LysR family transcriptional regulator [Chloroflexi bacterium AL-W]|nr:LysR family transcriptional regulator [Chloroflexi bacterium AL-N1]NOK70624.1 LysR family transcriptional regulator [Chloroflexi bacterium AL-N10]NOK77616.1 LysR family transcriptional regulator [Chloroflexi bacterium AL-N5]NOK84467.1 LysR family transcriptional regulator [Chloroflexi bacterium AL-W]NOK92356.1 LysR family transcriptional regulator [Chloroflexi bacterium AL-N15]
MELRHLRYFIAVAEELHFGRAATRLQMAQPPLSLQIRQLEQDLDVQLFHRTKRRVELTHAGHIFLEEARATIRQAEQARLAAQRASRGEVGQLHLGFVRSATYHVLPELMRAFRRYRPTVEVTLHEHTTMQQVHALHQQRIDVGIVRPPIAGTDLFRETLLQETLVLALPDTHRCVDQASVSLQTIATEPFIMFPRHLGPGLYDQIVQLCHRAGFSPNIVQEAVQMQTIVSLVAAELGIALVPASITHFTRTGVVYCPLQEPSPTLELALAWRLDERSPVVQALLRVAKELQF